MRILFFFLIIQSNLIAQNNSVLVYVGTGYSTTISDESYIPDRKGLTNVWHGGINYTLSLKEQWLITTGININQRGFRVQFLLTDQSGNILDDNIYEEYKQQYLSVPLLFGVNLGNSENRFSGFIKIGASGGYLVNASYYRPEITVQSLTLVLEENTKNVTDDLFKWDLCSVLKTGIRYSLGTENQWAIVGTIGSRYSFVRQYFSNHLGIYGQLGLSYNW